MLNYQRVPSTFPVFLALLPNFAYAEQFVDRFTMGVYQPTWIAEMRRILMVKPKNHIPSRCSTFFNSKTRNIWLVVSTHLKNISQLGWLFPIYGKIKNVPNHQPGINRHISGHNKRKFHLLGLSGHRAVRSLGDGKNCAVAQAANGTEMHLFYPRKWGST